MTVTEAAPWTPHPATGRAAPLVALIRLRIEEVDAGRRVVARMPIEDDANLAGHFPGMPIYPGAFVIETLCQAMAAAFGPQARLRTVTSVRFTAALLGGDELELTADVITLGDTLAVKAVGRRRDGTVTTVLRAVFGTDGGVS
ncbi:3-hydroxyacyl-ACP dehydratase [Micromonospora sp. ATA32]|nr:3-hydroxyacyl-ACP dehydratase [Micromonospora sp. ATA32]